MKRFGVLPDSFDLATDRIDPYETDQAYWRSLWYQPPPSERLRRPGKECSRGHDAGTGEIAS